MLDTLLAFLGGLLPLAGGTIRVPADAGTLQLAIDLAQPGDTILVQTPQPQTPVLVDKPLTILGDPQAVVMIGDGEAGDCLSPALLLRGPGSGIVTLAGVRTITGGDCFSQPAAIGGDGFDELHVFSSDIRAADSGQSGLGFGAPAIEVDVGHLLVVDSFVTGGRDDSDDCAGFLPGNGYPGIAAPGMVTILDSTVRGGDGGLLCCKFGCGCPPGLVGLGGQGGVAVLAPQLFSAGSILEGGTGSTFLAYEGYPFVSSSIACGKQPDGDPAEVGEWVELPETLWSSGPLSIGTRAVLGWNAPPPGVLLYIGPGLRSPSALPGDGWSFLGAQAAFVGFFPAGQPSLSFQIPSAPSLIGLPVAFQLMDARLSPSRPVASVIGS